MLSTTNTDGGFPLNGLDKTERGEAFAALEDTHWHAVWTRSHSEELVADQLAVKGFQVFLPKMSIWSRRGGKRHASVVRGVRGCG